MTRQIKGANEGATNRIQTDCEHESCPGDETSQMTDALPGLGRLCADVPFQRPVEFTENADGDITQL